MLKNIVTKEEIVRVGQFLLLSQCFQKLTDAEVSERVCIWERVKYLNLSHLQTLFDASAADDILKELC